MPKALQTKTRSRLKINQIGGIHIKNIILSVDSLEKEDLKNLLEKPYMSKYKNESAIVWEMEEIYPTLTYPIHSTMVTGLYPKDHGINHNKINEVEIGKDFSHFADKWHWYKSDLKSKTLMDYAYEDGQSIATILWPTSAGEKRWTSIPEIWPIINKENPPRSLFKEALSDNIYKKYYDQIFKKIDWTSKENHYYPVELAIEILEEENPDLFMVHIIQLDTCKHFHGKGSLREIDRTLTEIDIIINRIIETCKKLGTFEQTRFFIFGDHGHIDIDLVFYINMAFVDEGLIDIDDQGRLIDYKAYAFAADFSVQVFLKDSNEENIKEVANKLLKIKNKYPNFIDQVFDKDQARDLGLAGDFDFVIEGQEGIFLDGRVLKGNSHAIKTSDPAYKGNLSSHGHLPSKGSYPGFMAFGKNIKNVEIDRGHILQITPTLARSLGLSTHPMERSAFDIFEEDSNN